MECNPNKSPKELAPDLNTSQLTICLHLKKIRKVRKLVILVPDIARTKEDCIYTIQQVFLQSRKKTSFQRILQMTKKWVFYDNVQHKKTVWITTAYPKGEAWWKKSYAVWWDHCKVAMSAWKSSKMSNTRQ